MQTKITVKLNKKEEFYSNFNNNKLSRDLSDYLIEECYGEKVNNNIVINIHHKFQLSDKEKYHMIDIIRANFGLKVQDEEFYLRYEKSMNLLLIGSGIIFLILYYLIFKNIELISEIFLILSWLVIWEATYSFVFTGFQKRIYIKRLKQLSKSKINFIEE